MLILKKTLVQTLSHWIMWRKWQVHFLKPLNCIQQTKGMLVYLAYFLERQYECSDGKVNIDMVCTLFMHVNSRAQYSIPSDAVQTLFCV